MTMNSKERLLRAIGREKPDRMPVTVHDWPQYHRDTVMDGPDALTAFQVVGMDADLAHYPRYSNGDLESSSRQWQEEVKVICGDPDNTIKEHTISTPGGNLSYKTGSNRITTWVTEHLIKRDQDIDLLEEYLPVPTFDKRDTFEIYDRLGDRGMLRGYVWGDQPGCWQHACCLMNPQDLILKTVDDPEWVHRLLNILLAKKLEFIEKSLAGAKYDIIETGGGAASDTVISPALHQQFCLPYDRRLHQALHDAGHKVVYHTCGGMMNILNLILQNGADASETFSPPSNGGNIADPGDVRKVFAGKIAMIGGMDQFNVLGGADLDAIHRETQRLFEGFGRDGGYICSACDHFFDVPVANLMAFAQAAQ